MYRLNKEIVGSNFVDYHLLTTKSLFTSEKVDFSIIKMKKGYNFRKEYNMHKEYMFSKLSLYFMFYCFEEAFKGNVVKLRADNTNFRINMVPSKNDKKVNFLSGTNRFNNLNLLSSSNRIFQCYIQIGTNRRLIVPPKKVQLQYNIDFNNKKLENKILKNSDIFKRLYKEFYNIEEKSIRAIVFLFLSKLKYYTNRGFEFMFKAPIKSPWRASEYRAVIENFDYMKHYNYAYVKAVEKAKIEYSPRMYKNYVFIPLEFHHVYLIKNKKLPMIDGPEGYKYYKSPLEAYLHRGKVYRAKVKDIEGVEYPWHYLSKKPLHLIELVEYKNSIINRRTTINYLNF